jgi:hypothetical protein
MASIKMAFDHSSQFGWMVTKCSRRELWEIAIYPLSSAVASVDSACKNNGAWANYTSSSAVVEPTAALASASGALGILTCHSWVVGMRPMALEDDNIIALDKDIVVAVN